MFAGPVCHYELLRIARRRRTYVVRFLFGLCLLAAVGFAYASQSGPSRPWYSPGELTIAEMTNLSAAVFYLCMTALAALILGLTPALVADAVATERQSKTLHYLLTSRLSSAEIVLGKLAARLIHVGVFPVLVLPVVSLLTLLGGVSPVALVLGYAALAATTYFLAGLAMVVSVLARRPREAVGIAYTLTAVWLFAPVFGAVLAEMLSRPWADAVHGLLQAGSWVAPPSPLDFVTSAARTLGGSPAELGPYVAWMVGMQTAYGTLFIVLAAWQLRPAFRRHEGRAGQGKTTRFARRWFSVRPCDDEPVFWKEAYFAVRVGGLARNLIRTGVYAVLLLILMGALYGSVDAFRELAVHGYGYSDFHSYRERMGLNGALRYGTPVLFVIWMLWLGGLCAAGISSEREQDTWISLLSTPLEANEILRGKMLGPLRATAHFGVVVVALWILGLLAGAVHPIGLLNALIVFGIGTAFIIALGASSSFHCGATWRARLWTQGFLVVAHIFCLIPLPSMGLLLGISLWSYSEVHDAWNIELPKSLSDWGWGSVVIAWYFGGLLAYVGAAYFLTRSLYRNFDAAAGRAQRTRQPEVVLKEWKPGKDAPIAEDAIG